MITVSPDYVWNLLGLKSEFCRAVSYIWTRGVSLRGLTAVHAVDGVSTGRLLTVGKDGQSLHRVLLGSAGLV